MHFKDYQTEAAKTAKYPAIGAAYVYPALGLANESGEVLGKIKKIFRDFGGELTDEYKEAIKKELGDVLWYIAMLSRDLGLDLEEIADENLKKLDSRMQRGTLGGDGDNR